MKFLSSEETSKRSWWKLEHLQPCYSYIAVFVSEANDPKCMRKQWWIKSEESRVSHSLHASYAFFCSWPPNVHLTFRAESGTCYSAYRQTNRDTILQVFPELLTSGHFTSVLKTPQIKGKWNEPRRSSVTGRHWRGFVCWQKFSYWVNMLWLKCQPFCREYAVLWSLRNRMQFLLPN
jgi:hypothetical protein